MQTKPFSSPRAIALLFVILAGALLPLAAHAQSLSWARRAGGSGSDNGYGVALAPGGGVWVVGNFRNSATFGPGESGQTALTAAGGSDIFLAKYNPDGTLAWAKRAGGSGADSALGIALAPDGSAWVTGNISGVAVFGPGESGQTTLSNRNGDYNTDIFLAKYRPDGTLAWVRREGGSQNDTGNALAIGPDGSVWLTGSFAGSFTYGGRSQLTTSGNKGFFLAKYKSDGSLSWVKSAQGGQTAEGLALAIGPDNCAWVTGDFTESVTFGQDGLPATLTSAGYQDIFLVNYTPTGTLDWARREGGSDADQGAAVAVGADGSIWVTGFFSRTITFGGRTLLSAQGGIDVFLAKYNRDGTLAWVKDAGGSDYDAGYGLALTAGGSAWLTGFFTGSATFAPGEREETMLTSTFGEDFASADIFLAKYKADGRLAWVRAVGGSADDTGRALAVTAEGTVWVAGYFQQSATFGQGQSQATLNAAGGNDLFLAQYLDPPVNAVNPRSWSLYE